MPFSSSFESLGVPSFVESDWDHLYNPTTENDFSEVYDQPFEEFTEEISSSLHSCLHCCPPICPMPKSVSRGSLLIAILVIFLRMTRCSFLAEANLKWQKG